MGIRTAQPGCPAFVNTTQTEVMMTSISASHTRKKPKPNIASSAPAASSDDCISVVASTVRQSLADGQHAIESNFRPVLPVVGNDDPVVDDAVDEAFERPQQMIGRYAEHRRAEAAELIEREDGALRRDLTGKSIDEMDFRSDGPYRTGGTAGHRLDDRLGRTGIVRRLDHVPRHFRMHDDADARMLRADLINLPDRESRVDRA